MWLGDVWALDGLPESITAVVSLCLVGHEQVPEGIVHVPFRLIDDAAEESNLNLAFVLRDAAELVAALREEGHEVLVHCVAASRVPRGRDRVRHAAGGRPRHRDEGGGLGVAGCVTECQLREDAVCLERGQWDWTPGMMGRGPELVR